LERVANEPHCETDWEVVADSLRSSRELVWKLQTKLDEAGKATEDTGSPASGTVYHASDRFSYARYNLRQVSDAVNELIGFLESDQMQLLNRPALLLAGAAGTGKSHLFCDVAKKRVGTGLPSVLLLGERFGDREPWAQIIEQLHLGCGMNELLGALDAAGEAAGSRALIMIDAVNESDPARFWSKYLASMVAAVERYPWLGLAVSVRSSYEDAIMGDQDASRVFVRVEHYGFAGKEYDAVRTFFDHYEIELPSVPLLTPEFRNPLFLKLFCAGLYNAGLKTAPKGLHGVTWVFDLYLESVDKKLARQLDYDPKSQLVPEAVAALVEKMADSENEHLPREQAKQLVDGLLPRSKYEGTLFRGMLSEGVLREDMTFEGKEAVYFSYQRFLDHLIAKHLLDKHLDESRPEKSFERGKPLGNLVEDEETCFFKSGIIEAMAVQLPERVGKELPDLKPDIADYRPVREALLESLLWRRSDAFSERTRAYINQHVLRHDDTFARFWDFALTVACLPDHPYNADMLHGHLMRYELPKRDSWWSTMLFRYYQNFMEYHESSAVTRLVDWASSVREEDHIDAEARRLCAIALAWMLTTSHRFFRDRATKAMISLLTGHMDILKKVLITFEGVNDPYVSERLYAVAYGCAMRSEKGEALSDLACYIFENIFKGGSPPPHILLRDYAWGVIELALVRAPGLDIDPELIRPPYQSDWPDKLPTKEELETEYAKDHKIFYQIFSDSDFAIYIINSDLARFSSRRLGEPPKPSIKEGADAFLASLTRRQRSAFHRLKNADSKVADAVIGPLRDALEKGDDPEDYTERKARADAERTKAFNAFVRTLGKKKKGRYKSLIERLHSKVLFVSGMHRDYFDVSLAKSYIFKRIVELGWEPELFDEFDRTGPYQWRDTNKPERMGKKYQWMAFHECLARVADNFYMFAGGMSDEETAFTGPWQLGVRDIDPSWLLPKTHGDVWKSHSRAWWFPYSYHGWREEQDDIAWIQKQDDLPPFRDLIEVESGGSKWLVLEGYFNVHEPIPPGLDSGVYRYRDIWWMLRSYLVRKKDRAEILQWAAKQDFWGRWMPESHDEIDLFLGEFFWSPNYEYHDDRYYGRDGWTTECRGPEIPAEIMATTEQYAHEASGYDCSINANIHVYMPCKLVVSQMGLDQPKVDGKWYGPSGELIVFDPSVEEQGPGVLLVRKDTFQRFLKDNQLDLLWTVLGEKWMVGGPMEKEYEGHMTISGAYGLQGCRIIGQATAKFHAPEHGR